jgi:DNA repair exonuclease SbcCD ATPase subunit
MLGFKDEMHSFKDEMLDFKRDTKNSLQQVLEYLSRIEDEIVEIKEDLRNNYEKKGWDKDWRMAIEKRLERIEKALTKKKLATDAAI